MAKRDLRLVPTSLPGHFTFQAPPSGFQPSRATDEELRRYGLPHRPDPKKFPEAARLWIRSMTKIRKFVTPELVVLPRIVHGHPGVLHDDTFTSSIWSGLASPQGAFDSVWGNWVVPAATVPPGGANDYYSCLWVGLNDAGSLFQAGSEQDASLGAGILGGLSSSYYAWYEWFPGPGVRVDQFPVAPGQGITVMVGPLAGPDEPSDGSGVVNMFNFSTGIAITPIAVSIPTRDFNGDVITPPIAGLPSNQAVWILERPSLLENGVPTPSALADYGEAAMVSGGALVKAVSAITVGSNDQGSLLNMIANDGVTVLSTATENPGLQFVFTGGPTA